MNLGMENMEIDDIVMNVDTKKSLLSLDDVVLSKIMKMLPIGDVTNLAETCVRLERLSDDHFRKYHSSLSWQNFGDDRPKPSESERVWKHCGKHVKMVKLSLWEDNDFNELLRILDKYCKNLQTMILERVWLTNPFIFDDTSIRNLFSKLKRFELIGCVWTNWCPLKLFFGENSTLEHLSIINCHSKPRENHRLELTGFNALTKLCVLHCDNVLTNLDLEECFNSNNIMSLTLSDVRRINVFDSILMDALVHNLHTLTVDYVNFDCDQLLRFEKLKSLTINCRDYRDIDHHIKKLKQRNVIEELVLSRIIISKATVKALRNFTSLTRLRLNRCENRVQNEFFTSLSECLPHLQQFVYAYNEINDGNIICIIKSMPKLRRLSFFGCKNALTTETYYEIEKILSNDWHRPKLEFVPPKLNSLKALNDVRRIRKSVCLRTDIYERLAVLPSE